MMITTDKFTGKFIVAVAALLLPFLTTFVFAEKPNILWISSEDHGPQMGCYGDTYATTPNVDRLAARGMLFNRAWSCAPVCAPARTTIISGMFPPSLGAEHMRSQVPMPAGKKMFPQFLREAGYYCSNWRKEDYNLTKPGKVWDDSSNTATYKNRKPGQPFFSVFNILCSHESQLRVRPHTPLHDPANVRVPAYHPDTPEVRQDWAQYYDTVTRADLIAGRYLRELADAGLAEDTIVFYWADHGSGMPRSKRWPCDSGLRVPMVVYFPEKWRHLAPKEYAPGAKSDRLVSFVDLAPTLLSLAGVQPPDWMQGHAFAGTFQEAPQPFIYGFRGRMDERPDLVRSVTDGRYVYLRNYMMVRSQGQHVDYQFQTPTTQIWWKLFCEGKTTDAQSIFWRTPKAPEELYDLTNDPDEVRNLADAPEHQAALQKLRRAEQDLARSIRDTGFLPEAEVHERAGGESPYDMGHDPKRYDFERVFAAAELSAGLTPEAVPELKAFLRDADSGVRYWGASGILLRGQGAVDSSKAELTAALADASASVRVTAAEALGRYGDPADLQRALETLKEAADPTRTSAYVAVAALNAIDALGPKAAPLTDAIRAMPTRDPGVTSRVNQYAGTLTSGILTRFENGVEASKDKPPNILFIFADDWGWGDLSCHGNTWLSTPHLDRLASQGTEFYQFNVNNPVCSPSRTAVMTGHFPARHGVHQHFSTVENHIEMDMPDWLDPTATMLPRMFKQAGYVTGHFGKWHLSNTRVMDAPMPSEYGYDEYAGFNGPGPQIHVNETCDKAIDFIKRHRNEPFFINLWVHEPHTPHYPSEESLKRYSDLDQQQQVYAAVLADGDRRIGQVLDTLRELDLENNTLVVFSSDNGPEITGKPRPKDTGATLAKGGLGEYFSVGTTGGLRGRKRSLYEGGVRVPFMVRWPGRVPVGKINETTEIAAVDLLPTFCAAAGITLPEGYLPDGENMLGAFHGEPISRTKPIFWEWQGGHDGDNWPCLGVRHGKWKLLMSYDKSRVELYDVPADRTESNNLADKNPEVVRELVSMLEEWKTGLPKSPPANCMSKLRQEL